MEFNVSSAGLLKGILDVSKAIPAKTALPILENFLFVLKDGQLEVTASDQELTLRTVVAVDGIAEEGSIAVPARQMMDLLKALPDQPITIKTAGEGSFECIWSNGNSSLPYFPAADYPAIQTVKDDALKVHFRMSIDTTNADYVEIDFNYYVTESVTRLDYNYLVLITNIKLEVFEDHEPYSEYKYAPATESDFIRVVSNAPISASVTMPLSLYRLNTNQIGSTVLSTKITEYPYLFQKRTELVQRFRLTTAPALPHTRLFNYQGKKWRIIAQEFHPWDDEYKLTLQHSPVLTDLPSNE